MLVLVVVLGWPAIARAAPEPIPAIELDRGNLYEPEPFASPTGGQFVTWLGQSADVGVHMAERGDAGGPFGQPFALSATGNAEPPSLSFTPDGGFYAIWGISSNTVPAESITRGPDGNFAALATVPGCQRFVDSASGPDGGIAVACRYVLGSNPPDTVRWGSSPALGPVTVNEDLTPPAYAPFLTPYIEWGPDGTIAIVGEGYSTTTDPPPANQTTRVRAALRGTGPFFTQDIATVTWPQEVSAGPPLVLDDGTVAVPLGGSAGARIMLRPPGDLTIFAPLALQGEGVWGAGLDSSQNIHAASGNSDAREYWSAVRSPGSDFDTSFPIPMPVIPGNGDAYLTAFEVAPDGTEYAVIRGDDGTYASSRSPGQSFADPVKLGGATSGNPESTVTRDGDLLVAWSRENGPGDFTVEMGGLDKTPPEVTVGTFPESVRDGAATGFVASATDAMGIESLSWDFDGQVVEGGDATHTFTNPGKREVSFTATDVAGQKTVVKKTVDVTVGPNSKPLMTLKAPKRMRYRVLERRGVRVVVTARPKVMIRAVIGTSKRNARLWPMRVRMVRKLKNRHVLSIKPKRARLGKRRSLRLYVQVTGTTRPGKRTTKVRTVRIRR